MGLFRTVSTAIRTLSSQVSHNPRPTDRLTHEIMRVRAFILLLVSSVPSCGPCQTLSEEWQIFVRQLKLGSTHIPPLLLNEENANEVVKLSWQVENDSAAVVRSRVIFLVSKIGAASGAAGIRQNAVERLASAGDDRDAGNVGQVWNSLRAFKRADFTDRAKDSLCSYFRQRKPYLDRLVKLIGYLEIAQLKDEIGFLVNETTNKRYAWAGLLALSRMRDVAATNSVVERVEKIKLNDRVVDEVYPDLVYTRQRDAIALIIKTLNDDQKNCTSVDDENERPIPCAYRAMEQLAAVVEDYPLKLDRTGDVMATNYEDALAIARKWFKQQGDRFKIRNDSY